MPSERPSGPDPHRWRYAKRLWSHGMTVQLVFAWLLEDDPPSGPVVSVTPPSGPIVGPSTSETPEADGPSMGRDLSE